MFINLFLFPCDCSNKICALYCDSFYYHTFNTCSTLVKKLYLKIASMLIFFTFISQIWYYILRRDNRLRANVGDPIFSLSVHIILTTIDIVLTISKSMNYSNKK